MKLRSARGVLESLRPTQIKPKSTKVSKTSKTRYNVVLTDPRGGDTTEEEEAESEIEAAPTRHRSRRPAAGKEVHRHNNMAQTAIAIHEDPQYELSTDQVEVEDMAQPESEGGESVDESMSESGESEDEVDESVVEDMLRLEESFKGISQKYRLINRIGEGTVISSQITYQVN